MTVDFDDVKFAAVHIWKSDRLPTALANSIGKLYELKTTLKGVAGSEVQYASGKSMLNSTYGMCVTDDFRNEYAYHRGTVKCHQMTEEEALERLAQINGNEETFLNPLWGIACTAYAQYNLFTAIVVAGLADYYQDTDALFYDASCDIMKAYIKWYNEKKIPEQIEAVLKARPTLDRSMFMPKNIKGEPKPIGVWTEEPYCIAFKTLGAKRYLEFREVTETDDNGNEIKVKKFFMTVAGANKKKGDDFFNNKYKENLGKGMSEEEAMMDCFDAFTAVGNEHYDPLLLKDDKLVAHYLGNNPNEMSCNMLLTDENGVTEECVQKYGVALIASDFSMTADDSVIQFVTARLNNPPKKHR